MNDVKTTPSTIIPIKDIKENIKEIENSQEDTNKNKKADSKLQQIEYYLNQKYSMRFNSILCRPEYKLINDNSDYKDMCENSIYRELEHNGYKCHVNIIRTLLKSDFLIKFNPIKAYFEGLEPYHSIEPDYIAAIEKYVVVHEEDKERFGTQFKKFIVRCLACTLNEVVNKQAFIIISPKQNCGKSTFCRWLCPPALSNYMQENIGMDKDSQIALTENFIINMDELATLTKADLEGLKSFMSKDVVKTRKPYDAKALPYKRVANFVGSTNNIEFLTDVTGSVRWLCFEIESINFDYTKNIPVDRFWAQALYLLKTGFKYQLTPEEIAQNELANTKYRQISIEEDLIQKKYSPGNIDDHNAFYSSTEILEELRIAFPPLSKDLHSIRIGKAMQALGFTKLSKRENAGSRKGYYVNFNK